MAQDQLISQLLADYNRYRLNTADVYSRRKNGEYVRSLTEKGRVGGKFCKAFVQMIEFCAKHSVEPRGWLYWMFKRRAWRASPMPNQLCNEKYLAEYRLLFGERKHQLLDDQIRREVIDLREKRDGTAMGYDPNRDITPGAEALKRRYVGEGDYQRCMEGMSQSTLGYHPRSTVCQTCPAATVCLQQLQGLVAFDILALRLGQITSEQAREIAWRDRARVN